MMVAPQKKLNEFQSLLNVPVKCVQSREKSDSRPKNAHVLWILAHFFWFMTAPHETPFVHDFNCYLRALLILE